MINTYAFVTYHSEIVTVAGAWTTTAAWPEDGGAVFVFLRRTRQPFDVVSPSRCGTGGDIWLGQVTDLDNRGELAMLSDNETRELLQRARTIAVVGLSDRPERDSNGVARFLQRNGYRILPVNPNLHGLVLGEQPYASLREIREHVDIVDIFRRPEYVPQVVEDAIAIGADAVWMQLGVIDRAAAQRAHQAGLGVVMDRCMAIEHRRLMRMVESVLY
jgi:predicted CoA-binding protein